MPRLSNMPAMVSVKTISSSLAGVVAILGSLWAIDTHYASAEDVKQVQQQVNTQIQQIRTEKIEDELFLLDIKKQQQKGKLDPIDAAMYERYSRRLQDSKNSNIQIENRGNK